MLTGHDTRRRGTELWCAGLPLVEERRLDREEQEELRRAAWRLLWRGFGSFAGVALLGGLLITLTGVLGARWDGTLLIITLLVVSLLLFLPATLFAREGWMQRGLLLFRDLQRGYARVFKGVLTDADLLQAEEAADAAQSRLIALGLLTLGGSHPQTVEVLPASRRVWRVGGETVGPWVEARWREVVSAPAAARPWPLTDSPVPSEGGADRRRLSEREKAELLREARRHWLRPFIPALLFTTWVLAIVALILTAGHAPKSADWWGLTHLLWVTLTVDAFFARRLGQARKMYQDAHAGEALVTFGGGTADGSRRVHVSETLPHSGRLWTAAGRPTAWRRIGR